MMKKNIRADLEVDAPRYAFPRASGFVFLPCASRAVAAHAASRGASAHASRRDPLSLTHSCESYAFVHRSTCVVYPLAIEFCTAL